MAEKKYKVADNTALVVKGVVLKPGEEIPDGALDADTVKTLVAAKKIVEDKDAPASGGGKKGGKNSGGNKGDSENAGAGENPGADNSASGGENPDAGNAESAGQGGVQQ